MFTIQVSEKIMLKLLEKHDAKELFEVVNASRKHLREWLPWVDQMKKETDYEPVIDMWLKQYAAEDGFQAAVLFEGKIVGMAGFHGIDRANRATSIGYWLAENHEGHGIMTVVVKKIVDLAFHEYKLNRVEIKCGVNNEKSSAIPTRLGFTREGTQRDAEFLYDHFHDCDVYSILAREWKS